jgi:hypothetical protein
MTGRSAEALKYLMGAYFHQDWDTDGAEVSASSEPCWRSGAATTTSAATTPTIGPGSTGIRQQIRAFLSATAAAS